MAEEPILLTDDPAPHVRRITLNRPAKRNALSNASPAARSSARWRRSDAPIPRCG